MGELFNIDKLVEDLSKITIPSFHVNNDLVSKMIEIIGSEPVVGSGGTADVKLLEYNGEKYAVKISDPCNRTDHPILVKYCKDMNLVVELTPSGKYNILRLPNYLSESIIGGYLYKLDKLNLTPHFLPIYGSWIDIEYSKVYTIMPAVKTDIKTVIKDKKTFFIALLQLVSALDVAFNIDKFSHYDLHIDNLLYDVSNPLINYYGYYVPSAKKHVFIENPGFMIKISDYGLARLQIGNTIVMPNITNYPINSGGQYSWHYDILSVISTLTLHLETIDPDNIFTDRDIIDLFNFIFNREVKDVDVGKAVKSYFNNGWRPSLDIIDRQDLLVWLAKRMTTLGYAGEPLEGYKTHKFETYDQVDLPNINGIEINENDPNVISYVSPGVRVTSYYNKINKAIPNWNFTPSNRQVDDCGIDHRYIHVCKIDMKPAKSSGYHFKLDCCKIDPLNYMRENYGVIINGGFFDIGNTETPIGPYKMDRGFGTQYSTKLDIPPLFKPYYRGVVVGDSKLDIVPLDNLDNLDNASQFFVTGPILVENGKLIMDKNTIETLVEYNGEKIPLFKCVASCQQREYVREDVPKFSSTLGVKCEKIDVQNMFKMKNCNYIKPGELFHGGNSNPRSMLIIDNNDDVIFVYVEGRDMRGGGVDFVSLAGIAMRMNAKYAINLDGGRSSALVWRTEENSNVVYTANNMQKSIYTVGNILGWIKKSDETNMNIDE